MRGYVICTSPRSGSNYLGQLLESTEQLGRPREYFNGPARRVLDDPTFPDAPAEQVQRILTQGATPNGVYALKAFADQWSNAASSIDLHRALPDLRFIHLRREDVLGQAISWARAVQTQQYRSTQKIVGAPIYNGPLILDRIHALAALEHYWMVYFARSDLPVLRLTYVEVAEGPSHVASRVARWMDIDAASVKAEEINLVIQRDDLSDGWRRQFLAEHGDPNRPLP